MASSKNKKSDGKRKKTSQGNGRFTKFPHSKASKLYKKKYKGQGK